MKRLILSKPIFILLIFAFVHLHIRVYAGPNKDAGKVRVALIGIKFKGLSDELQEMFYSRVENLLIGEEGFRLLKPGKARKIAGSEGIDNLLAKPSVDGLQALADTLQVDHIFWGNIANRNVEESDRALLVGELSRYDRKLNLVHRFEVLKYFDTIGVEMVKFKQEFVETIRPSVQQKKILWPWLVLAGVAVAGLISLTVAAASSGSNGDQGGGGGTPTMPKR